MSDETPSGAPDAPRDAEPLPLEPVPDDGAEATLPPDRTPAAAPVPTPAPGTPVSALDVCPSCGAKLRGDDTVLCLRCGFDLKTLEQRETETGVAETPEPPADLTPIVRAHWTDRIVLPVIIGLAAVALIVAAIIGAPSVYRTVEAGVEIAGAERLQQVLRFPILVALWMACGIGGVLIGAWLTDRPPGDVRPMVVRLLAIVVLARLVTFFDASNAVLELTVELLGQAVVFLVLTMLLFRLRIRAAATLIGVQAALFVALYALAHLVAWTTGS